MKKQSELPRVAVWQKDLGKDRVEWERGGNVMAPPFPAQAERIVTVAELTACARDDDAWDELRHRLQQGTLCAPQPERASEPVKLKVYMHSCHYVDYGAYVGELQELREGAEASSYEAYYVDIDELRALLEGGATAESLLSALNAVKGKDD